MNKVKKRIYRLIWTRAVRIYYWAQQKDYEAMVADGTIPESLIKQYEKK